MYNVLLPHSVHLYLVELLLGLPHELPKFLRVSLLQRLHRPLHNVKVRLPEEFVSASFHFILRERVGGLKTLEDNGSGLPRECEVDEKVVEGFGNAGGEVMDKVTSEGG